MEHANFMSIGLTDEKLQSCLEIYLAKAPEFYKSGNKVNKVPTSATKQLAFKGTNLFVLMMWFIKFYKLTPLRPVLSMGLVAAWALFDSGNYRIDDTLVTGRSGDPFDPIRAQAFFQLSMAQESEKQSLRVGLINTVLFGTPTVEPLSYADSSLLADLPSMLDMDPKLTIPWSRRRLWQQSLLRRSRRRSDRNIAAGAGCEF